MPRSAGIASRLVIAALGATLLSGTAVLAQGTQSPRARRVRRPPLRRPRRRIRWSPRWTASRSI